MTNEGGNNDEAFLKKTSPDVNPDNNQSKTIDNSGKNLIESNTNKAKIENIKNISNEKINNVTSQDLKIKPKKEIPIEKKPFIEFVKDYLLPSLKQEFKERGLEIKALDLKNTSRPIAGDKCWVVYCEIKDTCNFWLSFEKEDISSLKSISLCKSSQKPSVIESFLIDEKRITLQLIISRIIQRLNGQKLIGYN